MSSLSNFMPVPLADPLGSPFSVPVVPAALASQAQRDNGFARTTMTGLPAIGSAAAAPRRPAGLCADTAAKRLL